MSSQANPGSRPRILRAALFFMAALALAYVLGGFLLLPWYAKRELPRFAEEQLQQRARVGEISFNPFTLRLRATDFALEEKDGKAILGFGEANVALEWSSIVRRAWVLSEVRLANPALRVGISKEGKVNLAALAAASHSEGGTGPATADAARFNIRHIAISNGSVDFEDLRSGYKGGLQKISFELSPLTSIDSVPGPYALLAETPDGGKLRWIGELTLQPLTASGKLELENASLPNFNAYLDEFSTASLASGRADIELPYRFAFTEGKPGLKLENAKLVLREVALNARGVDAPFARFSKLALEGVALDTLTQRAAIQTLRIADLAVAAKRDANGNLDLVRIFSGPAPAAAGAAPVARKGKRAVDSRPAGDAKPAAEAKPVPKTNPAAWHAEIAALELANLSSVFVDGSTKKPLTLRQTGLSAKLKLELDTGAAGVRAKVSEGEFALAELEAGAAPPAAPAIAVSGLAFKGLRFDSGTNALDAELLRVAKFNVDAAMEGGRLSLLDFLPPAGAKSEKPMAMSLKAVEFANGTVAYADRSQKIAVGLERVAGKLANVSTNSAKPVDFELSAGVKGGGKLAARGRSDMKAGTVGARIEASGLPLAYAQPFLEKYASVKLTSGEATIAGNLKAGGKNPKAGGLKVSFAGAASLTGVAVDESGGVRLVGWKSLATDSLRVSLAPNRVEIDELRWTAPAGKFAIAADGSTNMSRAFARKDGTTQVSSPPNLVAPSAPPPAPAKSAAEEDGAFAVLVRRVRIEQGQLDFSDDSLRPAFGTRIHSLAGTVNGLSSERTARAQFALDGRVDEFGSAKLSGTLNPFAWRDNTAIAMQFRNIDLESASTYSIKFAGYRIASGHMSLDLNYRVRGSKLEGENRITLEKFTLGEKVESAGALDLPIALAIALLKDADGKIDLALPITGNIDDPKFGVGALIWQAVKTIIGNIVTAPFRALGRLFGGSSETTGAIAFDPGSSRLSPPAREQIGNIVTALNKRPELKLGIPARYDGEADAAALRRDALAREVAKRSGFKVAEDEAPGPIGIDDKQTRAALRALFAERFSAGELDKLKAAAEAAEKGSPRAASAAGETPKPLSLLDRARNLVSGEPQLADAREFYRSLLRRLRDTQPIPANALADLAQKRGAAIAAALAAAGVAPARVSTSAAPPVAHADAKQVSVELTLGIK